MTARTFRSATIQGDVSNARLYSMRALYLLNLLLVGATVWPQVLHPSTSRPLMEGGALSFYAELAGAVSTMAIGAALDVVVIPWRYVTANYVFTPGDRWKGAPPVDTSAQSAA